MGEAADVSAGQGETAEQEPNPEWAAPPEWRQDVQKIRLALGLRLAKRVERLLVRVQEEREEAHRWRVAAAEWQERKAAETRRVQEADRELAERPTMEYVRAVERDNLELAQRMAVTETLPAAEVRPLSESAEVQARAYVERSIQAQVSLGYSRPPSASVERATALAVAAIEQLLALRGEQT